MNEVFHLILAGAKSSWPYVSVIFYLTLSIMISMHIILRKQESSTALAWLALIWFSPFFGSLIYMAFGVNRIWRKTKLLKSPQIKASIERLYKAESLQDLQAIPQNLKNLANIHSKLIDFSLSQGNRIEMLVNGEQAYSKMLSSIKSAQKSIALCSYIFDHDVVGKRFADALIEASNRGVEVRVLVDAVGLRYSFPSIFTRFRNTKVKVQRFLPTLVPWKLTYINLRNHRKILVIDGKQGFSGGMNIRQGHCLQSNAKHKIQDIHFCIEGPVVEQMQMTFAMDWLYAKGENLTGDIWFPKLKAEGESVVRSIADGPDEDINTLQLLLCAAITQAKKSITILNPYFLPNKTLLTLLKVAHNRGVQVSIIVPEKNNLQMVHLASQKSLQDLTRWGCRVYLSKPPFEHSKVMLVDEEWSLIGSANWDARSLRLNFEFNLEVYDANFTKSLQTVVNQKIEDSKRVTEEYFLSRSLLQQIKQGIARMFIQYL